LASTTASLNCDAQLSLDFGSTLCSLSSSICVLRPFELSQLSLNFKFIPTEKLLLIFAPNFFSFLISEIFLNLSLILRLILKLILPTIIQFAI
jgi:hypothetical protein